MTLFKAVSQHLPGGPEKNHEKPVRIAGLQAKIWTWDFLNMQLVVNIPEV
jgi:hypothetical protein